MSYYRTCPVCGAHLDPGEKCECQTYIFRELKTGCEVIETMGKYECILKIYHRG